MVRVSVYCNIQRTHALLRTGTAGFDSTLNKIKSSIVLSETPSWNSILKNHVDSGNFKSALSFFSEMREGGAQPDHFTFPLVNRAICSLGNHLGLGEAVHGLGVRMGFYTNIYFCNTMIEVYVKHYSICAARRMFDEMCDKDVVSWTSMISGYFRTNKTSDSFELFHEMQMEGIWPNSVTLVIMLQACCDVKEDAVLGCQFHAFAIKRGLASNGLVQNSILTVLTRAGCLEEAESVFARIDEKTIVSWNIMISGYLSVGDLSKVIDLFDNVRVKHVPSHETLSLVLSAFARAEDLLNGRKIHGIAVKSGLVDGVMKACIVDFYSRCGELETAVEFFEEVKEGNRISWSIMMSGFIQNDCFKEAINLFRRMQPAGLDPNVDILRAILTVYTHLGHLQLGKGVHGHLLRHGFFDEDDKYLETALVNMYSKCGSILLARRCFNHIVSKDVVAWSSMIEGYAIHGISLEALKLFYQMDEEGIRPNSITFLSILSACSHTGLLDEACQVFYSMTEEFGVKPNLDHFTCMVDLLGRSGKLQEALQIIHSMDAEPDSRIWGTLLASCRTYADRKIGAYAARRLFALEPDNVGYLVLFRNIHTGCERWNEVENAREFMGINNLRKKPGWSCIEVSSELHMFIVGDRSHPLQREVYDTLECLTRHMENIHFID